MAAKIRVGLVGEHPIFREGMAYILASQADFDVVEQGETSADALAITMRWQPDILVVDHGSPGDGMGVIPQIVRQCPSVRIVVLTMSQDEEHVHTALREGVRGYLVKGASGTELVQAIRAVHKGDLHVSPSFAAKLLLRAGAGDGAAQKDPDPFSDLNAREREILTHIVEGRSNREIGGKLSLSEATIKYYVTGILQKLKVRNRVEAAILAFDKIPQRETLSR